jgi:hypothetical protein
MLSVVLGLKLKPDNESECSLSPDVLFWPRVRALLTFGIGGTTFEAETDFLLGTVLAVPAENVEIDAEYCLVSPPWLPPIDPCDVKLPVFEVSAGFSYGATGHNSNPARLTEMVMLERAGDAARIQIPQFAISFNIQPIQGGLLDARVFGFSQALSVPINIVSPLSNLAQHDMESAFPIANGERYIEITNLNPAGPLFAYVIFGLAL